MANIAAESRVLGQKSDICSACLECADALDRFVGKQKLLQVSSLITSIVSPTKGSHSMGQKENWKLFVETTRAKAEAHEKVAQHWNTVNTNLGLVLILLSAVTTVAAAIKGTPKMFTVGISGVTTLVSAVAGFLQPSSRKQIHCDAAKEFRSLMMLMIRCETDRDYEVGGIEGSFLG